MPYEHVDLLPHNATALERLLASVDDPLGAQADDWASIRDADWNPPDGFLPFLIWQYGLGALTPYHSNLRDLIQQGILWQRVLGTPGAVYKAISWIGYDGSVENFPPRRRRWNLWMLDLAEVRTREVPDLGQIEDLANLSDPARSEFWRGFSGYDVRAVEWSRNKWSDVRWSSYSGGRLHADGAKWSFGRQHDFAHAVTSAEFGSIGTWVSPGDPLSWGGNRWLPDVSWDSSSADARIAILADQLSAPGWFKFSDAHGVIGYRRARFRRLVGPAVDGEFEIGGARYSAGATPSGALIEALTDFGDGAGRTATSLCIVIGGGPSEFPGQLWSSALSGGAEIALGATSIEFSHTVRERVRVLLTF